MNTPIFLPRRLMHAALLGLFALPALLLPLCSGDAAPAPPAPLRWQPVNEPGCGGAITSIEISPRDPSRILVGGDMLGAGISTDGGQTWKPTFGFKSWEMADSTFSPTGPNVVWIGTLSGPYRSIDGGVHWTEMRHGMPDSRWGKYAVPIQKVLIDPNDPKHLLAFAGSHRHFADGRCLNFGTVWESLDAGAEWAKKSVIGADAGGSGGNVMTAAFGAGSSHLLYAALSGKGVYKSIDGGASWTAKNSGLPNSDAQFLAVHPHDPNTLWVSLNSGGVFRSTDGAATWTAADQGLDTAHDVSAIADAPSNPRILYAGSYSSQAAWKSVDGGMTWTKILDAKTIPAAAMPFPPQATWFAIDPANPQRVFTLNAVTLFGSQNGGATWQDMTAFQPLPTKPELWRGRGYSGYVSINFQWNPYKPGQAIAQAMDDGKLWRSDDALATWKWAGANVKHYGGGNGVTFGADGRTLYASFGQWGGAWLDDGVAKSTDGGESWAYTSVPKDVNVGAQEIPTDVYTLPLETSEVWVLWGGRLYHSSDSGASWTRIALPSASELYSMAADPHNPRTLYLAGQSGIYTSTNGLDFILIPGSPGSNPYGSSQVVVDPTDSKTVYVARWHLDWAPDGGLWRSDGAGWTQIRSDNAIKSVTVDPSDPRRLAACTDDNPWNDASGASGVWLSEDRGANWSQQNDRLPMLRAKVIRFSPDGRQLVVGLDGRGFEKLTWPPGTPLPVSPKPIAAAAPPGAAAKPALTGKAPAVPTGIVAAAATGQVTLTWNAVAGADGGYRVKRGSSADGPTKWIISGWHSPTYTDTTVTGGGTYYYVVSALGAAGDESADSAPVSAKPQ